MDGCQESRGLETCRCDGVGVKMWWMGGILLIAALCPLGVPQVKSSIPDLAMRPFGRSEEEDIVRAVVGVV